MARVVYLGIAIVVLLLARWAAPLVPAAAAEPLGDVARGQAIFEQTTVRGAPGCSSCHSVEPGVTVAGPSLAGVGAHAETLLHSPAYKGLATTPEQLLREAILTRQPGLWGGSTHLVIPEWEGIFDPQELVDLSTYLATLK